MNKGLIIIKPPYAGNALETQRIISFTEDKIIQQFGKIIKKEQKLLPDGTELATNLYQHLKGKWDGLDEMLEFFKGKPLHPFVYENHENLGEFLFGIRGSTEYEENPETIRGMMRQTHGAPKREYMNSVHIPNVNELEKDLGILNKLGIMNIK